MKNRGSIPIFTNFVGVHLRNIHSKFESNLCSGLREEVEKLKKVQADDNNDDNNDNGHRVIARVTLTHWVWLKTKQNWNQNI